jgi:hypothetical protein
VRSAGAGGCTPRLNRATGTSPPRRSTKIHREGNGWQPPSARRSPIAKPGRPVRPRLAACPAALRQPPRCETPSFRHNRHRAAVTAVRVTAQMTLFGAGLCGFPADRGWRAYRRIFLGRPRARQNTDRDIGSGVTRILPIRRGSGTQVVAAPGHLTDTAGGCPQEPRGTGESNPRARGNNEGPRATAPSARQTYGLQRPWDSGVGGQPPPDFQPGTGVPAGDIKANVKISAGQT